MRHAHRVAVIREAERALMAQLPPGTLMQRAAAGLAAVCGQLLGRRYGARVVVLAGSGDNGGDALYAGARLARRGARVVAVAAGSRIHEEGAGALRAAGGRVVAADDREVPELITEASLVLDGLLGIGGRGGLRDRQAALAELVERTRTVGVAGARAAASGLGAARPATPAGAARPAPRAGSATPGTLAGAAISATRAAGAVSSTLAGAARPATLAGGTAPGVLGGIASPLVVAVDLPSGIDADTGEVAGVAVRADVTVTFGTWKPGLLVDPGAEHAGVTELIDIGLGPHLPPPDVAAFTAADVAAILPRPGRDSDKYRRGVLGILAGSERFTGAAALAVGGAIRGGAGMVRLVSAEPAVSVVRQMWPEAVITLTGASLPPGEEVQAAGRVQAWLAGPGMGTDELARRRLSGVLAAALPALVDADGLTLLADTPELVTQRQQPTLLTPHAGELGRLLGAGPKDVTARRLEHASAAAARLRAWVLLKGSTTVIAPPPGSGDPVFVNTTGTSWLATAGTGDVLSGLAGALLAQGVPAGEAAAAAAFLHALAARDAAAGPGPGAGGGEPAVIGEPGEAPIGAADVIHELPAAIRGVRAAAAGAAASV